MTASVKYRGIDGLVVLGGIVTGAPLVNGAVAHSGASLNLDGGSTLQGVVRPGDTFTVAGDAQVYTVILGGVINPSTHALNGVTFSPAVVPAGGWADNSAISFASNSVAQAKDCSLSISIPVIDTTCLGDTATMRSLDIPTWTGKATALFDYGDTKQKAIVDQIVGGTVATSLAMALKVAAGKQFWGDMEASNMQIAFQRGAMVTVTYNFEGTGALASNWN